MKPLDPRLMRHARTARRYIVSTALSGLVLSLLVISQAWLISRIISPVITGQAGAAQVLPLVGALAVVVLARSAVLHLQEARAHRAAVGTTIELRRQVLAHAAALGPRWQAEHASETATLLTRGLDDLEPYLTRYLPQLLLAATATPLLGLVMLLQDLASTVVVVLTMPLIPVFMILIGRLTERHAKDRLEAMERLGSQVLDLIAGLPTLKALGREVGPGRRVKELGRAYNRTTMTTLRVAFLSGAVLEFLTTLSVAIIAVEVGFRLLFGHLDLATGLLVIMIAPEVYQPLRQVGFQFHASANGAAATDAVFTVLETPLP
ncbi:ABC transporter transmembrane domain-containing protein, partial [Actinomyces sp. 186855]